MRSGEPGWSAERNAVTDNKHFFPFYAVLPLNLLDRAYRDSEGELAWARADALQVVALAQHHGYTISLIEAWLPTRPGASPLIDDWQSGGPTSAEAFIETFRWEPVVDADRGLDVVSAIWADAVPHGDLTGFRPPRPSEPMLRSGDVAPASLHPIAPAQVQSCARRDLRRRRHRCKVRIP